MKRLSLLALMVFAAISLPTTVSAGAIRPVTAEELKARATRRPSFGGVASLPSPTELASPPAPRFPEKYRRMLSGSGYNALYGKWREKLPELRKSIQSLRQPPGSAPSSLPQMPEENGQLLTPRPSVVVIPVPTVNSKLLEVPSINTQSEPSIAIFGMNVVIGFNNSFDFATGSGFTGYSFSTNRGTTFTQVVGGLSPIGDIFPLGDPSLAVDDVGNFYFATLAQDSNNGDSHVLIYKSTDGGATFPTAFGVFVPCCDFLDKELIAIDNNPASPFKGTLYLTLTDFLDAGGTEIFSCAFTASTGVLHGSACILLTGADAQGSMPAVGPSGELYVAWEQFSGTGSPTGQALFFAKSTDGGATFPSAPAKITNVDPIFESFTTEFLCGRPALKGGIRVNDFPAIAVDTGAKSKFKGTVYVAWNDMSSGDPEILGVRSLDGGATWEGPVTINRLGVGTDQFFPWVSIKPNGQIGVIFYDRKNDRSNNWYIDLKLATSINGGLTWANSTITKKPFPVVVNADALVATCYMGDYNQITNNGTNFFMAWGDNSNGDPDVVFRKR